MLNNNFNYYPQLADFFPPAYAPQMGYNSANTISNGVSSNSPLIAHTHETPPCLKITEVFKNWMDEADINLESACAKYMPSFRTYNHPAIHNFLNQLEMNVRLFDGNRNYAVYNQFNFGHFNLFGSLGKLKPWLNSKILGSDVIYNTLICTLIQTKDELLWGLFEHQYSNCYWLWNPIVMQNREQWMFSVPLSWFRYIFMDNKRRLPFEVAGLWSSKNGGSKHEEWIQPFYMLLDDNAAIEATPSTKALIGMLVRNPKNIDLMTQMPYWKLGILLHNKTNSMQLALQYSSLRHPILKYDSSVLKPPSHFLSLDAELSPHPKAKENVYTGMPLVLMLAISADTPYRDHTKVYECHEMGNYPIKNGGRRIAGFDLKDNNIYPSNRLYMRNCLHKLLRALCMDFQKSIAASATGLSEHYCLLQNLALSALENQDLQDLERCRFKFNTTYIDCSFSWYEVNLKQIRFVLEYYLKHHQLPDNIPAANSHGISAYLPFPSASSSNPPSLTASGSANTEQPPALPQAPTQSQPPISKLQQAAKNTKVVKMLGRDNMWHDFSEAYQPKPVSEQQPVSPERFLNLVEQLLQVKQDQWIEFVNKSKGLWLFHQEDMETILRDIPRLIMNQRALNRLLEYLPVTSQASSSVPSIYPFQRSSWTRNLEEHKSVDLPVGTLAKICPLLVKLKIIELQTLFGHDPDTKSFSNIKWIPCLLMEEQGQRIEGSILLAGFYREQLVGFCADSEGIAESHLKTNAHLEVVVEEGGQRKFVVSLEQLDALQAMVANSTAKIPPILLLSAPNEQKFAVSASSEKKAVGSANLGKRAFSIEVSDEAPPQKKRKTSKPVPALASMSLSSASTTSQVAGVRMPTATSQIPLSQHLFWKNLSLNEAVKISSKCKRRKGRYDLFVEAPHEYPILKLIAKPDAITQVSSLHPALKEYQWKEVLQQLNAFDKGISRLLSFEMGLGKTYVMAEVALQLIKKGTKGPFVFVAPKSVTPQLTKELKEYFATIATIAWHHRFYATDENKRAQLISEAIKKSVEAIQANAHETLFALLPLLSHVQYKPTYEKLMQASALEANKLGFWMEIQRLFIKWMGGCDQAVLQSQKAALFSAAPDCFFSVEKNAKSLWNAELAKGGDVPFMMGNGLDDLQFTPPVWFAQLMCAAKLMRNYYREARVQIKDLKTYPQALAELTHFSIDAIAQASTTSDIQAALKREQGFIVTHYEACAKVTEQDIKEANVGALFLDEAQKIHTSKTSKSKAFLELTRAAKRKNPQLPILISTATPFENDIVELWTLLKIANPLEKSFKEQTFEAMSKRIKKLHRGLAQELGESEGASEDLVKCLILTFSHLEAFRQKVMIPLLARKSTQDPEVLQNWRNRFPQRQNAVIAATISEAARSALNAAHQMYAGHNEVARRKKKSNLAYSHSIKRILLHHELADSSFEPQDPSVKKAMNVFSASVISPKMNWIQQSSFLKNLFEGRSADEGRNHFKEMVDGRKKGIVFTEHLTTAIFVKLAAESYFKAFGLQAMLYTGEMELQEREKNLAWFKQAEERPKLLVIMKKTGSMGLNVPEASYVFIPDDDWNPSVDRQGAGRIMRANSVGNKIIVTFSYDTFLHHHTQSVRQVKNSLEEFFNTQSNKSVREQFELFLQLILQQYYQQQLNQTKDAQTATATKAQMDQILKNLSSEIDDETLQRSLQSVMPLSE